MITEIRHSAAIAAIGLALVSIIWAMPCDSTKCPMQECRQFGFIGGGLSVMKPDAFNDDLRANGLTSIKNSMGNFFIGYHKQKQRLIGENQLAVGGIGHDEPNAMRSSLMTGSILWNVGFDLVAPEKSLDLFPYAGIGIAANSFHIHAKSKTFATAISTDEPDATMWQAKFAVNIGLGFDAFFAAPDNVKGFVAGLRVGYLIDASPKAQWHSNGATISDLSGLSQNAFYARLILGGWGKHGNKDADKRCCMKKDSENELK